jgi:hypothetical protein
MAARLAGWRRVSQQGVILFLMAACPDGQHQLCQSGLIYYYSKCTQNTVKSYVTQGKHGLVLS